MEELNEDEIIELMDYYYLQLNKDLSDDDRRLYNNCIDELGKKLETL